MEHRDISALAWLSGHWRSEEEGEIWEETWSGPEGDGLVGMCRWVSSGVTKLYELMAIEAAEDGLTCRMRHFHRGIVPWESEKDGPMALAAVRVAEDELVLEDPEREFPRTVTYRREGDRLEVILAGSRDGEVCDTAFRFQRSTPRSPKG